MTQIEKLPSTAQSDSSFERFEAIGSIVSVFETVEELDAKVTPLANVTQAGEEQNAPDVNLS